MCACTHRKEPFSRHHLGHCLGQPGRPGYLFQTAFTLPHTRQVDSANLFCIHVHFSHLNSPFPFSERSCMLLNQNIVPSWLVFLTICSPLLFSYLFKILPELAMLVAPCSKSFYNVYSQVSSKAKERSAYIWECLLTISYFLCKRLCEIVEK